MPNRIRTAVLGLVSRSPTVSASIVRVAGLVARRRGAAPAIIDEAVEGRNDRDLARTLQLIVWAAAVARPATRRRPRSFRAADHLHSAAARAAAAEMIRPAAGHDDELCRQLVMIDDDMMAEERARLIERDLSHAIRHRATAPRKGQVLDPDAQLHIVSRVTEVLEADHIRPFLMTGTLLGAIREGHFMEYDYDIDLGVLPGNDRRAILRALAGDGEFDVNDLGTRIVAMHDSGIRLDIFEHYERDGLLWHGTKIHEWWNTPFELTELTVAGTPLWAPTDAERYLEECYGDWRRPVPFYEISFDTPNRRFCDGPHALRHLYGECRRALADGDRWTAESTARELRGLGVDVTDLFGPSPLLQRPEARTHPPSGETDRSVGPTSFDQADQRSTARES